MSTQQAARSDDRLDTALRTIQDPVLRERVRSQMLAILTQGAYASPEARPAIAQDAATVLAGHLRRVGSGEAEVRRIVSGLFGFVDYGQMQHAAA